MDFIDDAAVSESSVVSKGKGRLHPLCDDDGDKNDGSVGSMVDFLVDDDGDGDDHHVHAHSAMLHRHSHSHHHHRGGGIGTRDSGGQGASSSSARPPPSHVAAAAAAAAEGHKRSATAAAGTAGAAVRPTKVVKRERDVAAAARPPVKKDCFITDWLQTTTRVAERDPDKINPPSPPVRDVDVDGDGTEAPPPPPHVVSAAAAAGGLGGEEEEEVIQLSPEQQDAYDAVCKGYNTLILGSGGTGKSVLIERIREMGRRESKDVVITASTGIAAVNVKGCTLHSFAGVGLADKETVDELVSSVRKNRNVKKRWVTTELLVIDEISMVQPLFLHKLDAVARSIRGHDEPFGGMQIVFVGDFFQLPPVRKYGAARFGQDPNDVEYCFDMPEWPEFFDHITVLKRVFRQSDTRFAGLLDRARHGNVTQHDIATLQGRLHAPLAGIPAGMEPTWLVSRIAQAQEINAERLAHIDAPSRSYTNSYGFKFQAEIDAVRKGKPLPQQSIRDLEANLTPFDERRHGNIRKSLARSCPAEETVELKSGAQVLLLANIDLENGLANGTSGVIIGFTSTHPFAPVVRFVNGRTVTVNPYEWMMPDKACKGFVTFKQIPLKLAWAITVHKSQSMTLDFVRITLDKSFFSFGQAYVALSRVRTREGLTFDSFWPKVIRTDPRVADYETHLEEAISGPGKQLQGEDALKHAEAHRRSALATMVRI
jgi:ATP-dependent DNA helicase PIF1